MARFCTSCGSPVGEDLKFCLQCGKELAAPAARPPAASAAPTPAGPAVPAAAEPAPPAAPPVAVPPAPAKPSSPVLKIILIVVGIFVLFGILSVGACVYGVYRAKRAVQGSLKMDASGKSLEIQTPGGQIKLGQLAAKPGDNIAGVPVYPGATALQGGGQLTIGDKLKVAGQDFTTDDSVDKVVQFYKDKLGSDLSVVENEGHYRMSVTRGEKAHPEVVTIDAFKDEDSGKTKITIAHLGGEATQ